VSQNQASHKTYCGLFIPQKFIGRQWISFVHEVVCAVGKVQD
jgi:hypothetical protein